MSVTMRAVEASRFDDDEQPIPLKINAINLDAADYPDFAKKPAKRSGKDVEIPVLLLNHSDIFYKFYESLEVAEAEAGERFKPAVLELINAKSQADTIAAARARMADLKVYDGNAAAVVAGVGDNLQWFAEEERKGGAQSIKAKVFATVDSMEGASAEEKLAAVLAALGRTA